MTFSGACISHLGQPYNHWLQSGGSEDKAIAPNPKERTIFEAGPELKNKSYIITPKAENQYARVWSSLS